MKAAEEDQKARMIKRLPKAETTKEKKLTDSHKNLDPDKN